MVPNLRFATQGSVREDNGLARSLYGYRRLKRQGQQFAFVARAGEALAESLDLETTLRRLLAIIVPAFGDWAAIDLFDDNDRLKTVAAIHADPEKSRLVKRLVGHYTHNPRYEPTIAAALRIGRPMIIETVREELLEKAAAPHYSQRFASSRRVQPSPFRCVRAGALLDRS